MDQIDLNKIRGLFSAEDLFLFGFTELVGDDKSFFRFEQWLSKGFQAGMSFMANHAEIRRFPQKLGDDFIQTLVFGMPYYQGDRLMSSETRIAQYARMSDYHKVMRKKGESILASLKRVFPDLEGRVTVDTAPILERDLARRTREGFIGKNTCYIHPTKGSFFLLGEIHINRKVFENDFPAEVDPNSRSAAGGCGTCKRCQVNCPTGALDEDYVLDANKCLSYWTIEHRGLIPLKYWKWLGKYWFGCDICQLACPYNRKIGSVTQLPIKHSLIDLDLAEVATMDQGQYEAIFGGSPMTRAKRDGLRRNALIAMVVTKHPKLDIAISHLKKEASLSDVLRGTLDQAEEY